MKYQKILKRIISRMGIQNKKLDDMQSLYFVLQLMAWHRIPDDRLKQYGLICPVDFLEQDLPFEKFRERLAELKIINEIAFTDNYPGNFKMKSTDLIALIKLTGKIDLIEKDKLIALINALFKQYLTNQLPPELCTLMIELNGINWDEEVYLPFANNETLLLACIEKDIRNLFVEYKGDGIIPHLLNIIFSWSIKINLSSPLISPSYLDETGISLKKFQKTLANPPFEGQVRIKEDVLYNRFSASIGASFAPTPNLEHILAVTSRKAVIIVPDKFLSGEVSSEFELNKHLVQENHVETIISLQKNIIRCETAKCSILILNPAKKNKELYFVDVASCFRYDTVVRKNILHNNEKLVNWVDDRKDRTGISRLVNTDDIVENNFTLAVNKYIVSKREKEVQEVLDHFGEITTLGNLVTVIKPPLIRPEPCKHSVFNIFELCKVRNANVVTTGDIPRAGFIKKASNYFSAEQSRSIKPDEQLKPFDLLLSVHGTVGEVGIVSENIQEVNYRYAHHDFLILRPQMNETKEETSIFLYMYLRSKIGRYLLQKNAADGISMKLIFSSGLNELQIPVVQNDDYNKSMVKFQKELEIYEKIDSMRKEAHEILEVFPLEYKNNEY